MKYLTLACAVLLGGCSQTDTSNPVYLYLGLKPDDPIKSNDGIFNNFDSENGSISGAWWDAYRSRQTGSDQSDIAIKIMALEENESARPHKNVFSVKFNRQGYGANITLNPDGDFAEVIQDEKSAIKFSLKSDQQACVGVRYMESDGEYWMRGGKLNEYHQYCVQGGEQWEDFRVSLEKDKDWVFFPYSGNALLGNKSREKDKVVKVAFEFGLKGPYTLKKGPAEIMIDDVEVVSIN